MTLLDVIHMMSTVRLLEQFSWCPWADKSRVAVLILQHLWISRSSMIVMVPHVDACKLSDSDYAFAHTYAELLGNQRVYDEMIGLQGPVSVRCSD